MSFFELPGERTSAKRTSVSILRAYGVFRGSGLACLRSVRTQQGKLTLVEDGADGNSDRGESVQDGPCLEACLCATSQDGGEVGGLSPTCFGARRGSNEHSSSSPSSSTSSSTSSSSLPSSSSSLPSPPSPSPPPSPTTTTPPSSRECQQIGGAAAHG